MYKHIEINTTQLKKTETYCTYIEYKKLQGPNVDHFIIKREQS